MIVTGSVVTVTHDRNGFDYVNLVQVCLEIANMSEIIQQLGRPVVHPRWGSPSYAMPPDLFNAANPYAMSGAFIDPAVGLCVDTNMQCPIWASTGQCAINPIIMRRMCARSCGICPLGNVPGLGIAPGIGAGLGYGVGTGLSYGELGMNPLLGRSIYEQGYCFITFNQGLKFSSFITISCCDYLMTYDFGSCVS
uniref:ShKT domain-containing protein n=1 Tax=Angiostrongylus cantonensis TaxID=6313 RepID=A0A0K0DHH9_ANGCA